MSDFMKKDHRGMTVVELIVGLVIASIALTIIGGIFLNSTTFFNQYASKKEAKVVLDTIFDNLQSTLTYATDIYVSDQASVPPEWDETKENWIGFATEADRGYLTSKKEADVYGSVFYEKGKIKADISYSNGTRKKLTIDLSYVDRDGETVYNRKRTIEIVNATKFQRKIVGISEISNADKEIYLHYKKEPQVVISEIDTDEYRLYTVLHQIYENNTASDPDFYRNLTMPISIGNYNNNSCTCSNAYAYIGWQYRLDPMGNNWKNGGSSEVFSTLPNDRLKQMGIEEVLSYTNLSEPGQDFLYVVPCHFVKNTQEFDLVLYAYGSFYFDNTFGSVTHASNLIYIQEENAWYYFRLNETSGTKGTCKSIKMNNKAYQAFPIIPDATVTFTDSTGTKTVKIESSYQVKQFFVQYGRKVS